ncbi:MAG: hypothetical protein WCJ37_00630 [Syntrophus sp. (in: bacteria)]
MTNDYYSHLTGNQATFQYLVDGNTPVSSLGGKEYRNIPLARMIVLMSRSFSTVFPYISPLCILFGAVIVLIYGVFRLGMGRVAAGLCTLSFMISSTQINHLVPFWDKYYVRAPFVFFLVLVMGLLIVKPFKPSRTIGLATIAGAVMGMGLMFRPDLLIFSPVIALTFFCFLPVPMRAHLKVKLGALMFFILALFFSFSTCPTCFLGRGANSHAFIGGSTPFFDVRLGITDPGYDWGYLHMDTFTSSMSFAQAKVFDNNIPYRGYGPVDDQMRRIVKNFPADTLVRFYAAALKVTEIPFTYLLPPAGITSPFITAIYRGRELLLNMFSRCGPLICGIALLIISAYSLRRGIFCLLLLPSISTLAFVHVLGYYFFYLEFIGYWALGFILRYGLLFVTRLAKPVSRSEIKRWIIQPRLWWNPATQRAVLFASAVSLLLWAPLFGFRQYQSSNVSNISRQYDAAVLEPLSLEAIPLENEGVLLTNTKHFKPLTEKSLKVMELMADFSNQACDYSTVWITLRYKATPGKIVVASMDWSRSMSVNLAQSGTNGTRLFFPAMAQKDLFDQGCTNYFTGIEISADQKDCLRGLYQVRDLRQLPILLTMKRPLEGSYPYRRLAEEGSRLHTVPDPLPATRVKELIAKPLLPVTGEDIDYRDPIFQVKDSSGENDATSWVVHGYAKDNSDINPEFPVYGGPRWQFGKSSLVDAHSHLVGTDLLITKPTWRKKGSAFVARGKLYSGGVVFGLLKDNRPSGSVIITTPGAFDVVIEVPQDGMYAVALANYVAYYITMENRMVAQAGWVEP